MLNPSDIKGKTFEVQKNGYNPVEVDSLLSEISSQMEELIERNDELEAKLNDYELDSSAISDALVVAQREANKILNDAKTKAKDMIESAKSEQVRLAEQSAAECERIVNEHKDKCAELIKENTEETEKKIQAIKDAYTEQKEAYGQLKEEVAYFKANLFELYNKQIKLIMDMPELTDEELEAIDSGEYFEEEEVAEEVKEEETVQEQGSDEQTDAEDSENEAEEEKAQIDEILETAPLEPVIPKDELNDLKFGNNN